jgi:hypothetical protein
VSRKQEKNGINRQGKLQSQDLYLLLYNKAIYFTSNGLIRSILEGITLVH